MNRAVCISALILVHFCTSVFAQTKKPGDLFELKSETVSGLSIKFRYCPAGTIFSGKPAAVDVKNSALKPSELREFYIGETEVTMEQFSAVLGEEGMKPLESLAKELSGTPQLLKAVHDKGQEPALLVSLEGAVDFCNKLQEIYDAEQKTKPPTLESRQFRIPSYMEWQYAARAVNSAEQQSKSPHFGRWISVSQLSKGNVQKCQEIWNKMSKAKEFPGDQDSFLTISSVEDQDSNKKLGEILLEVFKTTFNSERNASGIGTLNPAGFSPANDWGIKDMHDGVTEWTFYLDPDKVHDIWKRTSEKRFSKQSLEKQDNMFLSGGSFSDSPLGKGALARFTIWGGPDLTDGEPLPIKYGGATQVKDRMPGFRVVMEKTIVTDWLYQVRHGVFEKNSVSPSASQFLETNREIAIDCVGEKNDSVVVIDFYRALVKSEPGNRDELAKRMSTIATDVSSSPEKSSKKMTIAEILANKKGQASGTGASSQTDDQAFFSGLAGLIQNKVD